jgi:hypothetical protein
MLADALNIAEHQIAIRNFETFWTDCS